MYFISRNDYNEFAISWNVCKTFLVHKGKENWSGIVSVIHAKFENLLTIQQLIWKIKMFVF